MLPQPERAVRSNVRGCSGCRNDDFVFDLVDTDVSRAFCLGVGHDEDPESAGALEAKNVLAIPIRMRYTEVLLNRKGGQRRLVLSSGDS